MMYCTFEQAQNVHSLIRCYISEICILLHLLECAKNHDTSVNNEALRFTALSDIMFKYIFDGQYTPKLNGLQNKKKR